MFMSRAGEPKELFEFLIFWGARCHKIGSVAKRRRGLNFIARTI
jgi:hypothetical protein